MSARLLKNSSPATCTRTYIITYVNDITLDTRTCKYIEQVSAMPAKYHIIKYQLCMIGPVNW